MRVKRLIKWVLIIGFTLFVVLMLCYSIKVIVEVRIGAENSGLHIEVSLLQGLFKRDFTLKEIQSYGSLLAKRLQREEVFVKDQWEVVPPNIRRSLRQGVIFYQEFSKHHFLMRMVRSTARVRIVNWRTVLGLDDAMNTALAVGVLWSFKGWILALVSCLSHPRETHIKVVPGFGDRTIESICHCEVLFRPAYLILVPMILILLRRIMFRSIRKTSAA